MYKMTVIAEAPTKEMVARACEQLCNLQTGDLVKTFMACDNAHVERRVEAKDITVRFTLEQ